MSAVKQKTKIVAVVGPTASGKTSLSIELAKKFGGEIISCDSMQVYKEMNIGTAKPDEAEMDGVVHHMLDFADPKSIYTCAAKAAAEDAMYSFFLPHPGLPA